jgi:queuosine precursor transporter
MNYDYKMNEIIFILHILVILFFLAVSVRWGSQALTVFVVLSAVLANIFVIKQMVLFGFSVTCSDVYMIGGILGLNLIQELFGKENAKIAVHASFLAFILFLAMSQIHLQYVPSSLDQTQGAFQLILRQTPRIIAASIFVYYLVQRIDVWFFGFLKKRIFSLSLRMTISSIASQCIDTILFSFLGLYGMVSSLFDVILVSFAVKCAIIFLASPAAAFFKRFAVEESA